MLTTVQDLGRRGFRHTGLPLGGAMDGLAMRLANLLVGNEDNSAGLEMTLTGAELEFGDDALVAVTGADMGALQPGRPQVVKAGERLRFGPAQRGCRTYLAVAGGLAIEPVLGGRGTDLRSGLGGHQGRAIQAGDTLRAHDAKRKITGRWSVGRSLIPAHDDFSEVRVTVGAAAPEFSGDFNAVEFAISPKSDRMGIRLAGPALVRNTTREVISAAVGPGTVQVPPDGAPIVLMADAQTIGGYPCLAHVIHHDLRLLAQARPGDKVSFVTVPLAEAHRLWRKEERDLHLLQEGLRHRFT
ncbi:MAG: biotin-dependent carboxyltransferase family protein [Cephaloticoccus sp.]|nr:biotin-dependent carboxyltransferase family protein [Cephaloticoccus sp.]MCF7761409.1 biotin-dependent carboxyltransferase family protein [Cephaloticoccus sp.]